MNKRKFDDLALPSSTSSFSPKASVITTSSQKTPSAVVAPVGLQSPLHFSKFQLQLYPINEATRKGLEEDNHYPYLELTLPPRKKISSVIKHLNFKWGNSKRSSVDIVLFPYDARVENVASFRKWTLKDCDVTAADVYAALGRPSVFRLRYGWFTNLEPKGSGLPFTFHRLVTSMENPSKNVADHDKQASTPLGQECETLSKLPQKPSASAAFPHKPNQSEENLKSGNSAVLSWVDCLSNMSFGALYSELEAEGAKLCNQFCPEKNIILQQLPISCDSFDTAIAAHIARYQPASHSTKMSESSVLDAEETCNPFSFCNYTSCKNPAESGDPSITPSSQNVELDTLRPCNVLSPILEHALDDAQLVDDFPSNERDESEEVKVGTSERKIENNHF